MKKLLGLFLAALVLGGLLFTACDSGALIEYKGNKIYTNVNVDTAYGYAKQAADYFRLTNIVSSDSSKTVVGVVGSTSRLIKYGNSTVEASVSSYGNNGSQIEVRAFIAGQFDQAKSEAVTKEIVTQVLSYLNRFGGQPSVQNIK